VTRLERHSDVFEAVERLLDGSADADDVLRGVVALLHERLGHFVRVSFVEDGARVPGPAAGEEAATTAFPIRFEDAHVADLEAGGRLDGAERALLERVAALVAPYALVGWDTGGSAWEP
jgi:hypothetical protein